MENNLLIVSYANTHTRNFYNYKHSLRKYGYKYKILGKGEKWKGFNSKISAYYNYLKHFKYNKNLLICITDCYDVLACNKPNKLIEKYLKNYNNKILFGCEANCLERNCLYLSKLWKKKNGDSSLPSNRYLNSGFILGKLSMILDLLKFTMDQFTINGIDDDQLAMCQYAQKYPENVVLDIKSSIIATIHYDLFNYQINSLKSYNNVKNIVFNTFPSFLHTPGMTSDLSYRLDYIGRKLFGDKYREETKLKRIEGFINNVSGNKVHKLYFIIAMLLLFILFYFIPIAGFFLIILIVILILFFL
jgi:hypothetical protein